MGRKSEEPFVRIPLQNIKFEDPYEQFKFEEIKSTDSDKVIAYLESALKDIVVTISFNH